VYPLQFSRQTASPNPIAFLEARRHNGHGSLQGVRRSRVVMDRDATTRARGVRLEWPIGVSAAAGARRSCRARVHLARGLSFKVRVGVGPGARGSVSRTSPALAASSRASPYRYAEGVVRPAVYTVVFFVLAPGTTAGLVPWLLTGWARPGPGLGPLDAVGVVLVALGLAAVVA